MSMTKTFVLSVAALSLLMPSLAFSEEGVQVAANERKSSEKPASSERLVQAIPELGQCQREPLSGVSALDDLFDKKDEDSGHAGQDEYKVYEEALARFKDQGRDYRRELNSGIKKALEARIKEVQEQRAQMTDELSITESERRNDAIAQFELFIRRYPDDPKHTPDVMFRLAELYYEKSAVDFDAALAHYLEQTERHERGELSSLPPSPERDYSKIIGVYQRLISSFGNEYRYADAVYYLLGYVLEEADDFEGSRAAWQSLVKAFPKSELAPEVWLRLGESYFDFGEFEKAAEAYKGVVQYEDSRFYDKALYKLAWTYFQVYDYDSAIWTFKKLISFYDSLPSTEATAQALRDEAIDYLAKSLTEDDWDNDGLDDNNAGVVRAMSYLQEGEPYEQDIVKRYAESLYELHDAKKYKESIVVYKKLIEMDPLAVENLDYQKKVIQIYDVLHDAESAAKERQRLADMFAQESPWSLANAGELSRMEEASEAVEIELRRRALGLHQSAQELKEEADEPGAPQRVLWEAMARYREASTAYREYLSRYPNRPESYDMRFYLAESLFYSGQYQPAARAYLEVAAEPYVARYREAAAWSAVKAYEELISEGVAKGELKAKTDPSSPWDPDDEDSGSTEQRSFQPEAYPTALRNWLAAIDFYLLRDIQRDGSRKPQVAFAYQAGIMALRFNAYDEARRRFRQVITCFPDEDLAADAMANILNTYRDENDFRNLEKWADIAESIQLGDPEITAEIQKRIKVFKLGAQFKHAEQLLEEKKHLEAAREFERLADQNSDASFLDKAYYNAAMAYKEVKHYDSAARIFEKLVYDQRFANSEFKTESTFELAENYKLFFSFGNATKTYLLFFERTEGTDHPNRPYALYTAALLDEYAGRLESAANTYERYANQYKGRTDAARALLQAADIHHQLLDASNEKRLLQLYLTRHGKQPELIEDALEVTLRLGDIATKERQEGRATTYYQQVIDSYEKQEFLPGTGPANMAAKAQFELVEKQFRLYKALRLKGTNQRVMAADLTKKKKALGELELAYGAVLPYKSLPWTIAAFYRLGDIYREFAETLYAAPEPIGLDDDELDMYITMIEDEGLKYEDVAIERFAKTVVESRRLKVTTEWAEKALLAINSYNPTEFPVYKDLKHALLYNSFYYVDAKVTSPEEEAEAADTDAGTVDGEKPEAGEEVEDGEEALEEPGELEEGVDEETQEGLPSQDEEAP